MELAGVVDEGLHPLEQPLLHSRPVAVHGSAAGQHLQEHHAEAEHVAFECQVARLDVLRRCVSVCALHL